MFKALRDLIIRGFINFSSTELISQNNFIVKNKSSYLFNLNTAVLSFAILTWTFNISVFSKAGFPWYFSVPSWLSFFVSLFLKSSLFKFLARLFSSETSFSLFGHAEVYVVLLLHLEKSDAFDILDNLLPLFLFLVKLSSKLSSMSFTFEFSCFGSFNSSSSEILVLLVLFVFSISFSSKDVSSFLCWFLLWSSFVILPKCISQIVYWFRLFLKERDFSGRKFFR